MYTKLSNFLIQFCSFGNFKKSPFYYQITHFPSFAVKKDAGQWLYL